MKRGRPKCSTCGQRFWVTNPRAMMVGQCGRCFENPARMRELLRIAARWVVALALFVSLPLAAWEPYSRPAWAREGCRTTRTQALIEQCEVVLSPDGCTVTRATCFDLYSGAELATDSPAQALHVDHLLPACEAWKRRAWSPAEFREFFNYRDFNLVVTRARTNLRKGDAMPDAWCPANASSRPFLARRFRFVAERFRIPLNERERAGLRAWDAGQCAAGAKELP